MPNARVGISPQQHEQSAHARKQGITLEDLKRQTALRLAQKQQKSEFFPQITQQKEEDHAATGGRSAESNALRSALPPTDQNFPRCDAPRSLSFQQDSPRNNYRSPRSVNKPNELQARGAEITSQLYSQPGVTYPRSHAPTLLDSSFTSDSSTDCKSKLPQGLTVQELKEITKIVYPRPQTQTLPHGLTVQELKEMTKARLDEQRRRSFSKSKKKQQYQLPPPPRNDAPHDLRDSHFLVDNQRPVAANVTNNANQLFLQERMLASPSHGYSPELMHSCQSHGFVSERILSSPSHVYGSDHMLSSPPHGLVGPPGFQSLPQHGSLVSGLETNQLQTFGREVTWQPSKDAWESGSVASHNSTINSDFASSECNTEELNEIQFHRTLSYPGGQGRGARDGFYDVPRSLSGGGENVLTPNQNRARAATLSPRMGLSHLHEDRPSYTFRAELGMPLSVGYSPIAIRKSPVPPRARIYSDNMPRNGDLNYNRQRTASAPSVATFFAMTGEMFGDVCGGLSVVAGDSDFYPGNDELPNSMAESILDESSAQPHGNDDNSSVFRSFPSGAVDVGQKNPWLTRNLFGGENGLHTRDVDEGLSLEFDSVLSLSGIDAPPSSFNQQHQQQDPLSGIFPEFGSSVNAGTVSQFQLPDIYGSLSSFASGDDSRCRGDFSHGD